MPFGNSDWLALTQEETLEPDIPICDPHHHFWDMRAEYIPYHRYLLHELAADIGTPGQMAQLKDVAQPMIEEWSATKKAPRHAAWLHEKIADES